MKKIDLILETFAFLREETTPPLARYACILVLARNVKPMRGVEIKRQVGTNYELHTVLDTGVRLGQIQRENDGRRAIYSLTNAGEDEAMRLLNLKKKVLV